MKKTTLLLVLPPLVCNLNAARRTCFCALGLLAALASGLPPAQAAVTEAWVQRYTNNGAAQALAVAVDGSGNVVVTGYSDRSPYNPDYHTVKYAAVDGALLWEKRYNGPANSEDYTAGLAVDGSGNVVVTGTSQLDFYTAKYAAEDGALLWEKRYTNGTARAVAVDGGGNVVVTGGGYTAKYAAVDGTLLWEKRNPGGSVAAAVDGSGNVVVTGNTGGTNSSNDVYTVKYGAADGALLWEKRNTDDRASAVAVDRSGNVVVTGYSHKDYPIQSDIDYYTIKYAAADGALLWEKHRNGLMDELDYTTGALAVDGSGNVLVTGSSIGNGGNADFHTAKYAAVDGALLWEKRYNGPINRADLARAVVVDASGNVLVTGVSTGSRGDSGYYTAKYAGTDGALLWEKRYDSAGYYANSLALGPNGLVAVTGSPYSPFGPGRAWATVVYRENLPPVSITLVPDGIRLRFTGVTGRSYTIERAPAVTGPWTTINAQTATASGLLEHSDTTPPVGAAFYRALQP